MRRMYSKNQISEQIISDVNAGIESGTINVGLQIDVLGVGQYQYQEEIELGEVLISTNITASELLSKYKAVIFTMNNSFVLTPIAQNGQTLSLGSFAYDSQGNSAVARIRLQVLTDDETGKAIIDIIFDATFSKIMEVAPGAMLLGVK